MKAYVRRQDIWHTLNRNRYATAADLAAQYGVSQRTIYQDIQILSLSHPIESAGGRNGGYKVADWCMPRPNAYSDEELDLLKKCREIVSGDDLIVLNKIINRFSS